MRLSFEPTADTAGQRLLRGVMLVVVFGLCGTYDILNNNFARWVARASSMPEEEEFHAKDRAALVAAAHPARRGGLRPRAAGEYLAPRGCQETPGAASALARTSTPLPQLTGAGIFQHC